MYITGIICEYNPLHLGHKKQLDLVRQAHPKGGIVCLMSGNFVQRGKPAIVDKMTRAKAAILSGADLVLELPVTATLSSAEGFAAQGVRLLSPFCQGLCFGAESGSKERLFATAEALLSPAFSGHLKEKLREGLSFPAARQAALAKMGCDSDLLCQPNDILAVEYCKAILAQNSSLEPTVIRRQGNYHDTCPDKENPSATALRQQMKNRGHWLDYVPVEARDVLVSAPLHTVDIGERAILARLRTMTDEDFEALPYGSEGLWRKLMKACRENATLEEILTAVKSKRYTRTRLDRMVMCAFLSLTKTDLDAPAPYARVLALNDKGREILKAARSAGDYPNIGEKLDHPYQSVESRCGSLYGLFAEATPETPTAETDYRVFFRR